MSIVLKNISKKFNNFVAVENVNFTVNKGELVALLGPSGSGKSTILRIIAGLEKPDKGKIYFTDNDITYLPVQRRKIGFVFQHYALFKHMNVYNNIAFGLKIKKKSKKYIMQKVKELIELVKLKGYENHYPKQLSGGQQQRVALARSLAAEPSVLLLDEPFGALDAKIRKNLAKWLKNLQQKLNITTLFVTHDQNEAIEIADKIAVINNGKLEQFGIPEVIYEYPKSKFVAGFVGNVNVIEGHIKKNKICLNNNILFDINKQKYSEGNIILLVRQEDIQVEKYKSKNCFESKIININYKGNIYEIELEFNNKRIYVIQDKNLFLKNNFKIKENVFIKFRNYNIFRK